MALKEVAYGLDVLKAHGVGVMTSYAGKYLGDPAFTPLMEELNRRKAVVFVHPLGPLCCSNLLPGVPDQVVEYNSETSRTVASLAFSGTLGKFPDIRFIFSHGGGTVPVSGAALRTAVQQPPGLAGDDPGRLRRAAAKTLFRYGTGLQRVCPGRDDPPDADRTYPVYGSDFPAAAPDATTKGLEAFGLTVAQQRAIGRDNAVALMPTIA